jgi:hypothetical protein
MITTRRFSKLKLKQPKRFEQKERRLRGWSARGGPRKP